MDERQWQPPATEIPIREATAPDAIAGPSPLADARALTILTTEHWSLLSARGLVYNEAFARAGMFLSLVSGTFVALGLVSTATGFSSEFLSVTVIALALDLFVGLATLGRLADASREDLRYLQGMNRLRHAYHEIVPGLERYFVEGRHDDIRGVFATYEVNELPMTRSGILHGLTTAIGMVGVIDAALLGVLAGVVALLASQSSAFSIAVAVAGFAAGASANLAFMSRSIARHATSMRAVFPTPPAEDGPAR